MAEEEGSGMDELLLPLSLGDELVLGVLRVGVGEGTGLVMLGPIIIIITP